MLTFCLELNSIKIKKKTFCLSIADFYFAITTTLLHFTQTLFILNNNSKIILLGVLTFLDFFDFGGGGLFTKIGGPCSKKFSKTPIFLEFIKRGGGGSKKFNNGKSGFSKNRENRGFFKKGGGGGRFGRGGGSTKF